MYSGLYATFHYMQACYPYLKETQGSVINFASGAGLFGNYGQCAYAAAKEGIRGLPVLQRQNGDGIISMSILFARWHGQHSWNSSRKHIRMHLRKMWRCRRWDIWAMQNRKLAVFVYSWHHRISSIWLAKPLRWRADWDCVHKKISKIHTKHTGECNCVPLFFEKRSAIICRKFE